MSDKYEGLRRAAEAGKRAESDYGQSFIRRNADQAFFEQEATPDVILSLLQEHEQLLGGETPEEAWKRGYLSGFDHAAHDRSRRIVPPMTRAEKDTLCSCGHRAIDHWRQGAREIFDCAITCCPCRKFKESAPKGESE